MIRKFSSLLIAALAALWLTGCNKDSSSSDDDSFVDLTASTMVTNFQLEANRKILANLDSVFFSIDLANRSIYNADSLPYGTDVSRMVVTVKVPNSARLEMYMPSRFTGQDTVVDLTANPRDSINFVDGRNYLRVIAPDETSVANYSVKVNVHRVLPDSLRWSKSARGTLPSNITYPTASATVRFHGQMLSLASSSLRTTLNVTADPFDFDSWQQTNLTTLPEGADVNTLTATTEALYILTADGALHTTTDPMMASWSEAEPASAGWSHIYGAFGDRIVGVRGAEWATWPPSASGAIADMGADFPVKQTSQLVEYTSEWSLEPQAMMAGGITASGSTTGAVWGFDGQSWFRYSSTNGVRALPDDADGYTIFPYFTFVTWSNNYKVTKRATWLAIGHFTAADKRSTRSCVYTSLDNGLNWSEAPVNLQLPDDVPPFYCARAYVLPHTMSDNLRAITPITEWDTDFVYVFGGLCFDPYDRQTKLRNQMWRAVIERLTFKPLQ